MDNSKRWNDQLINNVFKKHYKMKILICIQGWINGKAIEEKMNLKKY